MTKLTIDLDNYSEADQELIQGVVAENENKGPIWIPKHRQGYWSYSNGIISEYKFFKTKNLSITDINIRIGNVFKTKEAAQRMVDRRKRIGIFENKMMEFSDGYEYSLMHINHFIKYSFKLGWQIGLTNDFNPLTIYMTKESSIKAVEWANKHYPEGL